MIKQTQKILVVFAALLSGTLSFGCSNVFIASNGFAATARTMDFEYNTGFGFSIGKVGENNVGRTNLQKQKIPLFKWQTKYPFLGQNWRGSSTVIDGVNNQGLYAGFLYLPSFAKYPAYNPNDKRPALGFINSINYVLGTSQNVAQALSNLSHVQLVKAALEADKVNHPGVYGIFPLHLVLRDKSGHSAVIEWVNGETVIHKTPGPVLTNSPTLNWQVSHAHQYDYVSIKTTAARFDGITLLGTGFQGIPGDWSAVSRFARAYQVVANMPKPNSELIAVREALTALETVQVPPGTNPSPTLWKSVVDLKASTYYLVRMYYFENDNSKTLIAFPPNAMWSVQNVDKDAQKTSFPNYWTSAEIKAVPESDIQKVMDFTHKSIASVVKQDGDN